MEDLIAEGLVHGVLDLTPHELTEEVVGAGLSARQSGQTDRGGEERDPPGDLDRRTGVSLLRSPGIHPHPLEKTKDLHAQSIQRQRQGFPERNGRSGPGDGRATERGLRDRRRF